MYPLLLALQIVTVTPAASGPSPVCPHRDGMIDGPVVPTAEVARGIFNAVAKPLQGERVESRYVLTIADEGAVWVVYQALPDRPGTIQVGGGGIEMHVDKCTGAISEMHYAR